MTVPSEEVRSQAKSRAAGYGFLAWLFLEQPDCGFIARLQAKDVQDNVLSLASGAAADSKIIAGIQEMMSQVTGNDSQPVENICLALARERARLLRGLGHYNAPPPPYESLYRTPEAGGGISVLEGVAAFYRAAQVDLPAQQVEQIDYLGLELDLMRLLCEEENSCRENGDNETAGKFALLQQNFFQEHLLLWVPHFCELMFRHPTAGFYRGVARLLLGFLEEEAKIETERQSENQELSRVIWTGIGK